MHVKPVGATTCSINSGVAGAKENSICSNFILRQTLWSPPQESV